MKMILENTSQKANCHGYAWSGTPNIKRFREQEGMSQEKLAAVLQLIGLDLNQKAVSRIETGAA